MTHTILLVGCGKMGGALLSRWKQSHAGNYFVIDPQSKIAGAYADLSAFPSDCTPDVVVFAVKPQELASVLPAYKTRFGNTPLYLSIAAGKTLSFFASHLGDSAQIIRAMPNTPALVGKGMTALTASPSVSPENKKTAEALMNAVGKTLWIDDEQLMDAVTAISGSGPAYVFLFLDSLTKAGINAGLPADTARALALETITGSAALASGSNEDFASLRKNVTSPGGTTEAALTVLLAKDNLESLIGEAVRAAVKRSKEMAS